MRFTENIRTITLKALDELERADAEIKELESQRENYYKPRFDELMTEATSKRENIIASGRDSITKEISDFKARIKERYTPKGEEITADANLLNCGIALNENDIESLIDKYKNNNTMQRLLHEYASKNNLNIDRKYIGEAEKSKAADEMINYYNSVMQRPEYSDVWRDREQYQSSIGDELMGE